MAKEIVAPTYGPIEEIIESGSNGLLFPAQDQSEFLLQIETFLENPEIRRLYGRPSQGSGWANTLGETMLRRY